MIEVTGNLWTYPADFRVITTNGSVRRDGACVMGRGCAKEAATKWPKLPYELGERLGVRSVIDGAPQVEYFDQYQLFAFPVKFAWMDPADLRLIRRSAQQLARLILPSATYVLPRPGCGNGQRTWGEVQPLLLDLPDNVHVIDFPKGATA